MGIGPLVIGYDGSTASRRAIDECGALFAGHEALLVVVWEASLGLSIVHNVPAIPSVPLDIRVALDTEKSLYEAAQQLAHQGVQLAEKAALEAEGLVVADEITIAETIVRVANERDAQAIVLGTDGIGLTDVLMGSTTRTVIQHSTRPVVVVREPKRESRT